MLSIEEIKLLIEKLERVKKEDFQKIIDENLQILRDIEKAVDVNNREKIDYTYKTPDWFRLDMEQKRNNPYKWQKVDEPLRKLVQTKIYQFSRSDLYNSLEIGPGDGMFSMDFRAWKSNYFLDILGDREPLIRKKFPRQHQVHLRFVLMKDDYCAQIPKNSCNFVFSWDTFVFLPEEQIRKYLQSMKNVLIPGGYCFINYADCHFDEDLGNASRGYWAYNTKTLMSAMIKEYGYEIVEMNMFKPGASYAIFRKPGKQNPVAFKVSELTLD
tara:strand:+ start:379 stop:1188 length:810 start_codon:yes stop_codon:yes gene_type:complete